MTPDPNSIDGQVDKISEWWKRHADWVIDRTAPKAVEYGAADLDIMGHAMLELIPEPPEGGMTAEERAELGRYAACMFYALGKVARMFGAIKDGRMPNADCEFDLEVYAVMMARIRETGRWV